MPVVQVTAWDTYLVLTRGLLPALTAQPTDAEALKTHLGQVGIRVTRYAPLWGEHGPMLKAALRTGVLLYRDGDHVGLADLMRVVADRLYVLSASPRKG